jgi:CHAT domain-containing protein/tetratricopeptide (TPR) repeat protein
MKKILYPIIILIVASIANLCYADDSDNHRAEIAQLQAQSDSLYAVGVDLYHAGRYSEAIPFFTESDKIDKAILDSTSNRRDYSAMWLASCYYKLNDTVTADSINPSHYMVAPIDRRLTVKSDSLSALGMEAYNNGAIDIAIKYGSWCAEIEKAQLGECWWYANSLSIIAYLNQIVGNYDNAILVGTDALRIYEKVLGKEHPDYATSLGALAVYYADYGNYSEAIRLGSTALNIQGIVLGRENVDYITTLGNLIRYNAEAEYYNEAIRLGTDALNLQEKVLGKNNLEYIKTLNNVAFYNSMLEHFDEAIQMETEALNLCKADLGEEHPYYVIYLNNLANYNEALNNFNEAIRLYTEVIRINEKVLGKEHPDYTSAVRTLAFYNAKAGNYSEAIRLCLDVLNIQEKVLGKEHPDYAASLSNLAAYNAEAGNYADAIRLGTEALNISEKVLGKGHPDYANSLGNLAVYYGYLGNYSEAIRLGLEECKLKETILGKLHQDFARSLNTLATCYAKLGDYNEAIRYGLEAINIIEKTLGKEDPDYAASLSNLSTSIDLLGYYRDAIVVETKALTIREKALGKEHPDYAYSLSKLAAYNAEAGNYNEAMRLCTEALNISEKVLGKEHPDYANSLGNLAVCHAYLGNYTEAIRLGTEALNIIGTLLGREHLNYVSTLHSLAWIHIHSSDTADGLQYEMEYCKRVTDLVCRTFPDLTSNERSLYWDKYNSFFLSEIPRTAYKYNSTQLLPCAYSGLLFGKGLLLNAETELRQIILESGNDDAISAIDELRANRLMLNKQLEKPISERTLSTDSLNQVINGLEHKLLTISKEYGDYTKNLRIDVKDVQAKLSMNDIAVEFASFQVRDTTIYCAYLLKQEYESPKMKVCLKQTDRDIFANAYSNPTLSKTIWGTLADELEGVKNVYFAPSGELYNIAIESLPDWEDSTKLVSDRWNLYRLSSTRELALIKDKNQIQKSVVYGGLKFNADTATIVRDSKQYSIPRDFVFNSKSVADSLKLRNGVKDLPGTKLEATAIDKQLKAVKIDDILRTDSLGTEASFKALSGQKKNLLHIATHGFYWTESDVKDVDDLRFLMGNNERKQAEDKALTRSGLLFAGANNALMGDDLPDNIDDGILTAQEISQLDLRGLDLVVLSACETGLGEITGDGVFGLQRGFKKAGAQSIMMSLWKVDDEATQMLMTQFYTNLTSGKSKRQSLLDAQRYLREYEDLSAPDGPKRHPYSDPRYWAAFILLDAID